MTISNQTSDEMTALIDGIIKAAIDGGDVAIEAFITAQLPFFANPILQYILDMGVSWIGGIVYDQLSTIAINLMIDFKTNGENSDVLKAAEVLQAAQASNNQGAIDAATKDLIAAYGNLVHVD